MKRISTIFIALIIFTLGAVNAAAFDNNDHAFIFDNADFLTDDEENIIGEQLQLFYDACGLNIGIVSTAEDYTDDEVIAAAEGFYDSYFGIESDGVLLLMDSANGNYVLHMVVAGIARDNIDDTEVLEIIEDIKPYFEDYDEYGTVMEFIFDALLVYDGGTVREDSLGGHVDTDAEFMDSVVESMIETTLSYTDYYAREDLYLADNADFLTGEEEDEIIVHMSLLADVTGWNVGIVSTAEDYTDAEVIEASEKHYDDRFGIDSTGVLLLMDSANGNYVLHMVVANGARSYISDSDVLDIVADIIPSFEDYDERMTVLTFLSDCQIYYEGETLDSYKISGSSDYTDYGYISSSREINTDAAFAFFIIAIIATVVTALVVWNRYHKHSKISAAAYLNKSSLNIYNRSDRFVRETTTKTRNSSDSGGSSSHGGGHHGGGGSRGHR
ncbi:MAG: TPM domain-containing protein [Ruminococcus sp.]|jgi:uncharacterized membrane protein YgcG|nr:TPM domain-containing protein [Ruminococcus sp.]